jgi:hypothetical protein
VWLTSGGNVEALGGLAKLLQVLNGLFIKLNLLEVLADARRSDRLGDDGVVAEDRPGYNDLGSSNSLALSSAKTVGDSLHLGSVDKERDIPAIVAESGVCSEDDVLLGAVFNQGEVGDARVTLNLVNGRDHACGSNDAFELRLGHFVSHIVTPCATMCSQGRLRNLAKITHMLDAEVGNSDGTGLGFGKLGHCCINTKHVSQTLTQIKSRKGISSFCTFPSLGNCDASVQFNFATIGNLGELVVASLESDGPVDEVELRRRVSTSSGAIHLETV